MSNQFNYSCPKCGGADEIDIAATVWVRLTVDGTDVDASSCGDHEWDDATACSCGACGWAGFVNELKLDDPDDPNK